MASGGGAWRWGGSLLLLALALAPVVGVLGRAPQRQDHSRVDHSHADHSRTDPPHETAATLPEAPATLEPPPSGPPEPGPPAPDGTPAAAPAVARALPRPPDRWQGHPGCPRDRRSTGDYNRCLYDFTRASEQELEAELANALAVIDMRSDLPAVQRGRWRNVLDEAQSRFLLYRNFDCQSVAPFEGPRGIGNFEQRALCLIEANTRRARELRGRYGSPLAMAADTLQGPWPRAGTYLHCVPPRAD